MKLDKPSRGMWWPKRSPSLKLELALGFGVVIALTLVLGVASYLSQGRSVLAVTRLLTVDNRMTTLALRAAQAMYKARRAESDMLLSVDEMGDAAASERHLPLVQSSLDDMREYLTSIQILSTDPAINAKVKQINDQVQQYEKGVLDLVDLSGKLAQAGPEWVTRFHQIGPEVDALINGVKDANQRSLRDSFQNLRQHEDDFTSHRKEVQLRLFQEGVATLRAQLQAPFFVGAEKRRLATLLNDYAQIFQGYTEMAAAIEAVERHYVQAALAIDPLLEDLHTISSKRSIETLGSVESAARVTRWTIFITLAIATILGAIVAMLVARRITGSVKQLVTFSGRVAVGDFSARAPHSNEHEFAVLASAMNQMAQSLENSQAQLLAAARLAGMAEIATNVLHNVGNVLNSVNVSAGLVNTRLRRSRLKGLARAVSLMDEHADNLGDFLTQDAKGKLLPTYLRELAPALELEHEAMARELVALGKNLDHIKDVIASQQSYTGTSRIVVESVTLDELVDDALRMNVIELMRQKVNVVKDVDRLPALPLDRNRVLQILVNLISNAKQAIGGVADRNPCITLVASLVHEHVLRITVSDNGEGIAPENLTRVFSHGFTTRTNGHGFGLHSCIVAAQEMGGSLSAHSDGVGQGATFTLEIPVDAQKGRP